MKKLVKRIAALAVVTVMGLSMVACGKKYKSVEAYVNSPEVQKIISDAESEVSGMGMKIEVTADGDKMVYTYTYENIEKADGMEEQLESAMSAQDSTFQTTANEIKKVVKADHPSVVIEYVDCNGEMIYSKEYVAE